MNFLNSWLQGIMIAVIVSTIIEMIIPNGNSKKYIKVVLGVYVVFNIITPVVNKFFHSDFEISSILNMEEYTEKMEAYETDSKNIEQSNENSIKQIYVSNLKKDIKAKLEERGYKVTQIKIEIVNDDTYQIKSIFLSLNKKEEKEETSQTTSINEIEIEKIEIQVGEKEQKENTENNKQNQIMENEKKEIKKYIASVYEVKESQIYIE